MNKEEQDIENILNQKWPSASQAEVDADCDRVLHRLQSRANQSQHTAQRKTQIEFRWRRFVMVVAAAGLVLAVIVGFFWQQRAFAVVESAEGPFYRVVGGTTRMLQAGAHVASGDTLRADNGAEGMLKLPDG